MFRGQLVKAVDLHAEYNKILIQTADYPRISGLAASFETQLQHLYASFIQTGTEASPIHVIIGGSFPYKTITKHLRNGIELSGDYDVDFYQMDDYPNTAVQEKYEEHRIQVSRAMAAHYKTKGDEYHAIIDSKIGFLNATVNGDDYNILVRTALSNQLPYEVMSNFQTGFSPRFSAFIYDKQLDRYDNEQRHFRDFQQFIHQRWIISYRLLELKKGALNSQEDINLNINKLAFVLKSYMDPIKDGARFDINTARELKGLLEDQGLKSALMTRLYKAYGPNCKRPRFKDQDELNYYIMSLKSVADFEINQFMNIHLELFHAKSMINNQGQQLRYHVDILSKKQENEQHLQARINALEEETASLRSMIQVKNEQIEALNLKHQQINDQQVLQITQQTDEIEKLNQFLKDKTALDNKNKIEMIPSVMADDNHKPTTSITTAPSDSYDNDDTNSIDDKDSDEDEIVKNETNHPSKELKVSKKKKRKNHASSSASHADRKNEAFSIERVYKQKKDKLNSLWGKLAAECEQLLTLEGLEYTNKLSCLGAKFKELHKVVVEIVNSNDDRSLDPSDKLIENIRQYFTICERLSSDPKHLSIIYKTFIINLCAILYMARYCADAKDEKTIDFCQTYLKQDRLLKDSLVDIFPHNLLKATSQSEIFTIIIQLYLEKMKAHSISFATDPDEDDPCELEHIYHLITTHPDKILPQPENSKKPHRLPKAALDLIKKSQHPAAESQGERCQHQVTDNKTRVGESSSSVHPAPTEKTLHIIYKTKTDSSSQILQDRDAPKQHNQSFSYE